MRVRVRLAASALAVVVLACQPADEPDLGAEPEESGDVAAEPVGAPEQRLPSDLDALLAGFESTATQWQSAPVVAEIVVELDAGEWTSATVTYLAADADRFLLLRRDVEGTSQERPTLEGFELAAVSGEAIDAIPGTGELLHPGELVDAGADVAAECGVGEPTAVLYTTGAPAAWDGERWTEPPAWTATITGDAAAVLDPFTGAPAAPDPCVAG